MELYPVLSEDNYSKRHYVTYSSKRDFKKNIGSNQDDSDSNICKKKTNKKNYFCLTFSKKVYVFNHQLLMEIIFFI